MITLIVLAVAISITGLLVLLDRAFGTSTVPLDTERQERWLVRQAPKRLQPMLHYLDRRAVGGAVTAVAFAALLVGALLVGFLLDSVDNHLGFALWDKSAAQWGADNATSGSTRFLEAVTLLGSTYGLVAILAIVGAVMFRSRGWGAVGYLALVGVGVSLLNNGLKMIVGRQRPDVGRLVGASGSSFPSGHSAAAAACWAAIALVVLSRSTRRRRALGATAAAFVALSVATSRVLLGVHWLTDVLAGLAVGWTWFFICTLVFGGRLLRFGEPADRVARASAVPVESDRQALTAEPTKIDENVRGV